jgi:hypothetical protein
MSVVSLSVNDDSNNTLLEILLEPGKRTAPEARLRGSTVRTAGQAITGP